MRCEVPQHLELLGRQIERRAASGAALRDATPPDRRPPIEDLFEAITLFDNRAVSAAWREALGGKYAVTLTVSASKLRADDQGNEREVPLDDWIDIGVFAGSGRDERALFLEKRRLTERETTIEVVVAERLVPAVALVWLGWTMVRQDRDLERQQLADRLDRAAAAVAANLGHELDGIAAALVKSPDECPAGLDAAGTMFVAASRNDIVARAGEPLLYLPAAPVAIQPPEAIFRSREIAELQQDYTAAAAEFTRLAASGEAAVRAGALVRLARRQRLIRKPPPGAIERVRADMKPDPMGGRGVQFGPAARGVGLGQFAQDRCTNQHAITLDDRQIRGGDNLGRAERLAHLSAVRLAQQPRQHGTGLRVQIHREPRSASRSAATRPGFSAGFSAR